MIQIEDTRISSVWFHVVPFGDTLEDIRVPVLQSVSVPLLFSRWVRWRPREWRTRCSLICHLHQQWARRLSVKFERVLKSKTLSCQNSLLKNSSFREQFHSILKKVKSTPSIARVFQASLRPNVLISSLEQYCLGTECHRGPTISVIPWLSTSRTQRFILQHPSHHATRPRAASTWSMSVSSVIRTLPYLIWDLDATSCDTFQKKGMRNSYIINSWSRLVRNRRRTVVSSYPTHDTNDVCHHVSAHPDSAEIRS